MPKSKTYTQITAEIARLQAAAEPLRKQEAAGVIARIKEAIARYGLTATDLGFRAKPGPKPKAVATPTKVRTAAKSPKRGKKLGKVPVKYRDGDGNTWTGRGNQPVWLREAIKGGAKLESFKI